MKRPVADTLRNIRGGLVYITIIQGVSKKLNRFEIALNFAKQLLLNLQNLHMSAICKLGKGIN